VLQALGYSRPVHVRGTLILGQCPFDYADASGVDHAVDLHWRLAAPLVFREVLPADALIAEAVPIAALGPAAFGPSLAHALAVACVHLIGHHRDAPSLLWLYEIAALARALDERQSAPFLETAASAGIRSVCRSALGAAREHFDDARLEALIGALPIDDREPSARLIDAASTMDELRLDLRVARGWGERITLLREHLWPDAEYMRAREGTQGWLPLRYARRAVTGASRWMRPKTRFDRTAAPAAPPADSAAASGLRPSSRTTR
jgi:hypothetical protein